MTLRLRLRRARIKSEYWTIRQIDEEHFDPDGWDPRSASALWVVTDTTTDELCAFAAADWHVEHNVQDGQPGPWQSWIDLTRCAILPDYRGQGLQRRLIRARLRWGKKLGARIATTFTIDNPTSARNLVRCGFVEFSPGGERHEGARYWRKDL